MKKLLLAFSLIAIFGLGITAASFTLPENTSTVELNDGDGDKKKKKEKKKVMLVVPKVIMQKNLVAKNLLLTLNFSSPLSN